MKKFLLSLACILGFVAVNAATVTIDPTAWAGKWTTDGTNYTATIDGYKVEILKASSTTALIEPTEYHIRVYQGAQLVITAPNGQVMKGITFTVDSNSKAASAADVTFSAGWTLVGAPSTTKDSTFGCSSDGLSTMELTAGKQLRISKIEISDEAGGTTTNPTDPTDPVTPNAPEYTTNADGSITFGNPFTGFVIPGANSVGGFVFTVDKSTGTTNPQVVSAGNLRTYANNTITVSGEKVTKVVITLTDDAGYRYTTLTPSTGALAAEQAEGDTEIVWEGDATTVTFTVGEKATMGSDGADKAGQIRIASVTIYGVGGEVVTPPTPSGTVFEKTTTLENGLYVFAIGDQIAKPAAASATYGRMNLSSATFEGANIVTEDANAYTIEVANGKATIKDANGRYYAMADGYKTSFQLYTELNEGCYWTYEFVGETVKFTNALLTTCFISQTQGTQGTWYTNVAPADAPTEYNLPTLYKKSTATGIAEVVVDENAPVEYYNLQGVRVENPSNGIFIRRQGNKATKVLVK
ncbi:MAG: hypothetical protein NC098_02205 [Lachnoclostridium sp.]|nr:hypothetical protein [Lachnoclostridium sp.]